jgi:hypothetical protein
MTLYVDSSALLKRYVDAPDSAAADELLGSNPVVATGRPVSRAVRRKIITSPVTGFSSLSLA